MNGRVEGGAVMEQIGHRYALPEVRCGDHLCFQGEYGDGRQER